MNPFNLKRSVSRLAVPLLMGLGSVSPALAADAVTRAEVTVKEVGDTDPGMSAFLERSAGYAVFPEVGAAALVVGGAHGDGVLFEKGRAMGRTSLSQVSVGAQLGGQTYSEIIVFETRDALANFKRGEFHFSAQASAVALKSGAAANAKYRDGVAIFTATKGGLMFEASIGTQKFTYESLPAS